MYISIIYIVYIYIHILTSLIYNWAIYLRLYLMCYLVKPNRLALQGSHVLASGY